jgi:Tol biopolymer transport system component
MYSRLSAVPRLASRFVAVALSTITLSAFAGKPTPPPPTPPPPPGITTRVSVAADGTQGNAQSAGVAMTPDARYVAFSSDAGNLVAGDTNGKGDVFVHDRATGSIERVSVASDGTEADNWSYGASISADGRYVAFYSYATTLVSGEQHYYSHVYLHDRALHTTERVSIASDGTPANSYSHNPSVSADGRYVTFNSSASNLVNGDSNGKTDVFVRDRVAGTTERVSLAADGTQANGDSGALQVSADGRYVLFQSTASNLVAADTNASADLFLYDRVTHAPERVNLGVGGIQASGTNFGGVMSADARWVVFGSDATNLVSGDTNGFLDVFLRDRVTGTVERVNVASSGSQASWGDSFIGGVSADGNVVAFISYADNLGGPDIGGYGDVFVRIRSTATTERVSVALDGGEADSESGYSTPQVSANGIFVVFDSLASNLVSGDTNHTTDVFVRERFNSP